jgi:hypothetical protein
MVQTCDVDKAAILALLHTTVKCPLASDTERIADTFALDSSGGYVDRDLARLATLAGRTFEVNVGDRMAVSLDTNWSWTLDLSNPSVLELENGGPGWAPASSRFRAAKSGQRASTRRRDEVPRRRGLSADSRHHHLLYHRQVTSLRVEGSARQRCVASALSIALRRP